MPAQDDELLERRHVTVVMALDTSDCMSQTHILSGNRWSGRRATQLHIVKEGACRVVDALQPGDHACVLSAGQFIRVMGNFPSGAVEMDEHSRTTVIASVKRVEAMGRSKIIDAICDACRQIMKLADKLRANVDISGNDLGDFWLVVAVTGGEDHSKAGTSDMLLLIREISHELGPRALRIELIGLMLSDAKRSAMRQIAAAASNAAFTDARNLPEVLETFKRIAHEIQCVLWRRRFAAVLQADEGSPSDVVSVQDAVDQPELTATNVLDVHQYPLATAIAVSSNYEEQDISFDSVGESSHTDDFVVDAVVLYQETESSSPQTVKIVEKANSGYLVQCLTGDKAVLETTERRLKLLWQAHATDAVIEFQHLTQCPELNGATGVIKDFSLDTGKYLVLVNKKHVRVYGENLVAVEVTEVY